MCFIVACNCYFETNMGGEMNALRTAIRTSILKTQMWCVWESWIRSAFSVNLIKLAEELLCKTKLENCLRFRQIQVSHIFVVNTNKTQTMKEFSLYCCILICWEWSQTPHLGWIRKKYICCSSLDHFACCTSSHRPKITVRPSICISVKLYKSWVNYRFQSARTDFRSNLTIMITIIMDCHIYCLCPRVPMRDTANKIHDRQYS